MPTEATKGARVLRTVVVCSLMVGAAAGLYVYNRELTERRRQGTLDSAVAALEVSSEVLGASLDSWKTVVTNAADREYVQATVDKASLFGHYIDVMVPGLDPVDPDPNEANKPCGPAEGVSATSVAKVSPTPIFQTGGPWTSSAQAAPAQAPAKKPAAKPPGDSAKIYLRHGQGTLQFEFVKQIRTAKREGCAISKQDLLPKLFGNLPPHMFEDVLLASGDDNGDVYYQFAAIGPRISRLDGLLAEGGATAPETSALSAWFGGIFGKREQTAGSSVDLAASFRDAVAKATQKTVADETSFSELLKVQLAGEEYLLILQPVPLVRASHKRHPENDFNLVIVGLIRTDRLDAETSALPKDVVAWVFLGLVVLCSLIYSLSEVPFKARLQPVPRLSVFGTAFCALTGWAALTLFVTHGWFVLFENDNETREALKTLADAIDENVQDELCNFYQVLDGMTNSGQLKMALAKYQYDQKNKGANQNELLHQVGYNLLAPSRDRSSPTKNTIGYSRNAPTNESPVAAIGYSYPFFDQISWSTSVHGDQIAKWSIHPNVTPKTDMLKFPWFEDFNEGTRFKLRAGSGRRSLENRRLLGGSETQEVYLQPLVSPMTGEYQTVLMKRYRSPDKGFCDDNPNLHLRPAGRHQGEAAAKDCRGYVGILIAPLTSVNSPVFPPGYGFAILRPDGTVLFSSHTDRNMRENFFQECGWNEGLMKASRTRTPQPLPIRYAGQDGLAYVHPLEALDGADWTVVTYRHLTEDSHIQLDTFTETMEFMIPHGAIMGVLVLVFAFALPGRFSQKLWPSYTGFRDYASLVLILTMIFFFGGLMALFAASRTLVFFEVLILPLLAVFLSVAFLLGWKFRAFAIACIYPLAALANAYLRAREGLFDSRVDVPLVLLGLGVCVVALFRRENDDSKRGTTIPLYKAAVSIGIMLLSVLPTIAYYRVAFQMVQTKHAMEDLVKVNQSLEKRTQDAITYYSNIQLDASPVEAVENYRFVRDRLSIENDRYDLFLRSSHRHGRLEFPQDDGDPTWIDTWIIPLVPLTNPGELWEPASMQDSGHASAATLRDQFFLLCRWPLVQFDYHRHTPIRAVLPFLNTRRVALWDYRRIEETVPDLGPARSAIYASTLILLLLISISTNWLANLLFFLKFKDPNNLEGIYLSELARVKANIVLLSIAGSLDGVNLDAAPGIQYLDCQRLDGVWDAFGSHSLWSRPLTGNEPVVLGYFDLCSDSEEIAGAKLSLLERLLFSAHRRVVMIASVDPVECMSEAMSGDDPKQETLADFFRRTEKRWNRVFLCFEHRRLLDVQTVTQEQMARRIYASCTDAQRAALYQISESGWVNPNNSAAIATLRARGWVRLSPRPVLDGELGETAQSTETIKKLAAPDEIRRWQASSSRLNLFLVGGLLLLAALLIAGKGVFQSLPAMASGLVGIVSVWKAVFGNRASAETPKGGDTDA